MIILISCTTSKVSDVDISHYKKGIHYYNIGNYDSAIYYLKSFLRKVPRYKEIGDTIIKAHLILAHSLENKNEHSIAILVYNELLKYVQRTYGRKSKQVAEIYLKMSNVYEKMGIEEQAVYYKRLYNEIIRKKF